METIQIARREFKYQIGAEQLPAIRRWLLRYCAPDENSASGDWYAIRSLYLDNNEYRLFRDAREKTPYRLKLRARAYGDATGSVKLEVKRRVRDLIVKTSASVKAPYWTEAAPLGLRGLTRLSQPSMDEFLQFSESLRATPKLLVYYERQAFSSVVDEYVRVTFDRRIKCQPLLSWDLLGDSRAWQSIDGASGFGARESAYIMEVKFTTNPPEWLRDFVLAFGLERRGYSKYVRGVQRAVCYRDPAWELSPQSQTAWRGTAA